MEITGRITDLFVRHSGKAALENIKIEVIEPQRKKPLTFSGMMPPCQVGDLFRFQVTEKSTFFQIDHAELFDGAEAGASFVLKRWFGESANLFAQQFKSFEAAKTIFYRNPSVIEKLQNVPAHEIRQGIRKAAMDWILCAERYSWLFGRGVRVEQLLPLAQEVGPTWTVYLNKNPYYLMKYGLDLTVCDRYAREVLTWQAQHPYRGFAVVRSVMNTFLQRGQSVVSFQDVLKMCSLIDKERYFSFDSVIGAMLQVKKNPDDHPAVQWWAEHLVLIENPIRGKLLQFSEIAQEEVTIVNQVKRLKGSSGLEMQRIQDKVKEIELQKGVPLNREQAAAIMMTLQHQLSIIMGRSGNGKTFTLPYLVQTLEAIKDDEKLFSQIPVHLVAPSGNASNRMVKTTARLSVCLSEFLTIDLKAPSLIIMDDAHLLDRKDLIAFFQKIPTGCQVVLCGDVEQQLPVTHSNALRDISISGEVPVVVLRQLKPEAGFSIDWANQFMSRKLPEFAVNGPLAANLQVIDLKNGPVATAHRLKELYVNAVRQTNRDEVIIITAHPEGPFSAAKLNLAVQDQINPPDAAKFEWKYGADLYRVGDRVRQIQPNPKTGVPQFAMGWIANANDKEVHISWIGYKTIIYGREEMYQFELAYVIPMHQAYGNQWEHVSFVILPDPDSNINRKTLYTAFSRCRSKAVLSVVPDAVMTLLNQTQEQESANWLVQRLKLPTVEKI